MTDDKIIKSLKWLVVNFPKIENPEDDADKMCNCINLYCQNAIDLINRQKAKIERLQDIIQEYNDNNDIQQSIAICDIIAQAKSNAIKEFAERLKGAKVYSSERHENIIPVAVIDWIKKEMTENDFME